MNRQSISVVPIRIIDSKENFLKSMFRWLRQCTIVEEFKAIHGTDPEKHWSARKKCLRLGHIFSALVIPSGPNNANQVQEMFLGTKKKNRGMNKKISQEQKMFL